MDQRVLAACEREDGSVDLQALEIYRTKVPLKVFLAIEEHQVVARDRAHAWRVFLQRHPGLLSNPTASLSEED